MRYFKESVETMLHKSLEAMHIEKLSSILKQIYGCNRFYTDKLDAAGIHPEAIKTLEDFKSVPLTIKAELPQASDMELRK